MAIIKVKAQQNYPDLAENQPKKPQKNLIDKADDWYAGLGKQKLDMDEDTIVNYLLGNLPSKGWKFTKDKIIDKFGEAGARVFDKFLSHIKKQKKDENRAEGKEVEAPKPELSNDQYYNNYVKSIGDLRKAGEFINDSFKTLKKLYNAQESMKDHVTTMMLIYNNLKHHVDRNNKSFNVNEDSKDLMGKLDQVKELLKKDISDYRDAVDKASELIDMDVGSFGSELEFKNLK